MSRHVASAVRYLTERGWVPEAGILLVLVQAIGCTAAKSEPALAQTAPPREEQRTPPASTPAEPAKPRPGEPPVTAQPKPAEPTPSRPAEQPQTRPPATPAPRPAAPVPPAPATPAPKPAAPPPPAQSAAPPPSPQQAAIVDLAALEKRLRDTSAIGVFTKLSLKNQVDDLLGRFRTFHEGHGGTTLAKLRESYDLLVLKVVSLLQDKDAPLARDVFSSKEALWNLLADPVKFKTLGSASTRRFAWRRE